MLGLLPWKHRMGYLYLFCMLQNTHLHARGIDQRPCPRKLDLVVTFLDGYVPGFLRQGDVCRIIDGKLDGVAFRQSNKIHVLCRCELGEHQDCQYYRCMSHVHLVLQTHPLSGIKAPRHAVAIQREGRWPRRPRAARPLPLPSRPLWGAHSFFNSIRSCFLLTPLRVTIMHG